MRNRWLAPVLGCLCVASLSHADALIVTTAMQASTVAEIFVELDSIQVHLEIGLSELPLFQGILPDELRNRLGQTNEAADFFLDDGLVIRADGGPPLPGRVESIQASRRIVRDDITGDPLEVQPTDAEPVVVAKLIYPLPGQPPRQLQFQAPGSEATDIGFVTYHRGLPVNDFRYMTKTLTLDLNWEDAWYSRFKNRNLLRQNNAPMSAYLYVEPYEVRREIIIRPQDLARFTDLPLGDANTIPVSQQEALQQQVASFLNEKNPVLIDGEPKQFQLDRIHFVRRSLRRTGIVDPPEDLDTTSATLGVIYVCPVDQLPQEVSMTWELFDDRVTSVPSAASDEAGAMPSILTAEDPILRWTNYLKNPSSHELRNITPPPKRPRLSIPVVTLACAMCLIPAALACRRARDTSQTRFNRMAIVCALLGISGITAIPYARIAVANPFVPTPGLSDGEATKLMEDLLFNVYRAFDRRDPSLIYDQLGRSIAGDLLEQVYLETRKTIEVENQGGLQVKVRQVTILSLQPQQSEPNEATYRANWRVAGSVGHWGHVHQRVNEPSALITLSAVDGVWKITAMKMQDGPK